MNNASLPKENDIWTHFVDAFDIFVCFSAFPFSGDFRTDGVTQVRKSSSL